MALRLTSIFTREFFKRIRNNQCSIALQHNARYLSGMHFDEAEENVSNLAQDPGNDVKLKMYALTLFKQGSVGPCNVPKPGALDFVGKAKWNAWNELGNLTQEDAQKTAYSACGVFVGTSVKRRKSTLLQ